MQARFVSITSAAILLYSTTAITAELNEIRSTLEDQKNIAVTIYNDNLALVKDQRIVHLNSGINNLAWRDVSAQIKPETALLRSLDHTGSFSTLEQNFDFDLLTPQKLLEKYVGKTISIAKTQPVTGNESTELAEVLSANNGIVLRIGNRIETGVPGRIIYDSVPSNLRDRPTLVAKLNNQKAAAHTIELSYLTGGLYWKADYVAELNTKDNSIDLSAWVTLTNTSGTSYQHAKLQLVAGQLNRVDASSAHPAAMTKVLAIAAEDSRNLAEEPLLEYHMYSLDRPTTIAENQTKQVALLQAANIPARKELVLQGSAYYYSGSHGDLGQKIKVDTFMEFDNKEAAKLGLPLPGGIMRVYKKDSQGNAQFVGEDKIAHTPKNETVRLKLGNAFDITADKKQTDFKVLPRPAKGNSLVESAYEIVIKNAKKEAVTVAVQEPIPGDWKILQQNHTSQKVNSNTAVWNIHIPAEGKTTLNYRVQVKY